MTEKLTRRQRQEKRIAKRQENKNALEQDKQYIKSFCGLGGEYSALELVIVFCAKLDLVVAGDVHPHQQIKELARKIKQTEVKRTVVIKTKKDFYSSRAWKILRYQAFEKYGNRCQCCGGRPSDGLTMHVDHVKPRSTHPELALDINNLQVLCEDCNVGKINQWDTHWKP